MTQPVKVTTLNKTEREILFEQLATAMVARVPTERILEEFNITKQTFGMVTKSPLFMSMLHNLQQGNLEIKKTAALVTQEDFLDEGRESLNTFKEVRDSNRPSAPDREGFKKEQALALKAAEFFLKAAGFGEVKKSEKTIKYEISNEAALIMSEALLESRARRLGRATIIDITPEEVSYSSPLPAEELHAESRPNIDPETKSS